jgi:tryptophan-rich sensory protein
MRALDYIKLIGCIVVCELVGIVGSFWTRDEIRDWYSRLNKPAFNPPNWVFGPVWTLLYVLMGIAAFMIWRRFPAQRRAVGIALMLFALQLALNGLWTPVFFGAHSLTGGLLIILLLAVAIAFTIWRFAFVSTSAAWLMVPYLLWVCFATMLNASILVRNT